MPPVSLRRARAGRQSTASGGVACGVVGALLLALDGRRDGLALNPGGFAVDALLPVANRPLALEAVASLAAAGVGPAVVACSGAAAPLLQDALQPVDVVLLEVPADAGPVGAVLAARGLLPDGPLVVHPGDAVVLDGLSGALRRFGEERPDVLVLGPGAAGSRAGAVHVVGPRGLEAAERLEAERGAAALVDDLPDAVRGAGGRGEGLAVPTWRYAGDPHSLLALNALLLDRLEGGPLPADAEDVDVHGPVVAHPTARLRGARIRGPVLIGPGARVQDSYVGPHTCIGAGAVLDGAEVEHSILMAGAEITHVGRRIDESVIGAGARVTRTFTMPSALRLHLGASGRVALS